MLVSTVSAGTGGRFPAKRVAPKMPRASTNTAASTSGSLLFFAPLPALCRVLRSACLAAWAASRSVCLAAWAPPRPRPRALPFSAPHRGLSAFFLLALSPGRTTCPSPRLSPPDRPAPPSPGPGVPFPPWRAAPAQRAGPPGVLLTLGGGRPPHGRGDSPMFCQRSGACTASAFSSTRSSPAERSEPWRRRAAPAPAVPCGRWPPAAPCP